MSFSGFTDSKTILNGFFDVRSHVKLDRIINSTADIEQGTRGFTGCNNPGTSHRGQAGRQAGTPSP